MPRVSTNMTPMENGGYVFPVEQKRVTSPNYSGTVDVDGKQFILQCWHEKNRRVAVKLTPTGG